MGKPSDRPYSMQKYATLAGYGIGLRSGGPCRRFDRERAGHDTDARRACHGAGFAVDSAPTRGRREPGRKEERMERAVPVLPADDLAIAKQFYVAGLGFQVRFEATEDGRSGIMGLERGTLWLTIDSPMTGHGRKACASLHVENADAYYQEWRERVEILRPPRNEYWGARTFGVTDPSGNTIFV